jgi:hypothetical protein
MAVRTAADGGQTASAVTQADRAKSHLGALDLRSRIVRLYRRQKASCSHNGPRAAGRGRFGTEPIGSRSRGGC